MMLFAVVPAAEARQCGGTVDTDCTHITADGTCHLFLGGKFRPERCIVYGGPTGSPTPECDEEIEMDCSHWSAPSQCILFMGGPDGRCIVW